MQGELALSVALTAYGNVFLKETEAAPPELFPGNSTVQHVESISFVEREPIERFLSPETDEAKVKPGQDQRVGASAGTSGWYRTLRRRQAERLSLHRVEPKEELPERVLTSFAGGVQWAIQVRYPGVLELWFPRWSHQGGQTPWKVRCEGMFTDSPMPTQWPPLPRARDAFKAAVKRATRFSHKIQEDWFPQQFREALELLESDRPVPPYYADMLPEEGYAVEARQLLAAGAAAWVFGGMGSFNDLQFQDKAIERECRNVADSLYSAVLDAVLSAVNAVEN